MASLKGSRARKMRDELIKLVEGTVRDFIKTETDYQEDCTITYVWSNRKAGHRELTTICMFDFPEFEGASLSISTTLCEKEYKRIDISTEEQFQQWIDFLS